MDTSDPIEYNNLVIRVRLNEYRNNGPVAEQADARGLGPRGEDPCGFESRPAHFQATS